MFAVILFLFGMFTRSGVPVMGCVRRPLLGKGVRFNGNGSYAVLGVVPRIALG